AMAVCDWCGKEVTMPYTCGYCGGTFCPKHRLPESHGCEGLEKGWNKRFTSRRIGKDFTDGEPQPKSTGGGVSNWFDFRRENQKNGYSFRRKSQRSFRWLEVLKNLMWSSATSKLLFVMVGVYFVQLVARLVLGLFFPGTSPEVFLSYFWLARETVLYRPWTLVTSVFLHGGFFHLLINGALLFFAGPVLERMIGSKRFTYLFLAAGIISGLGQVLMIPIPVLGASGSILGVLGALTAISPNMSVLLFFFFPMKLWMVTLGYGIMEVLLASLVMNGVLTTGIGHIAHIVGILVGATWGYTLRHENQRISQSLFQSLMDGYRH
ncbi:MAG: rhomboid family intramembrane serine protease, partial [Thermoproteota archaeon]